MRQQTINIYKYDELSDDAKQIAIEWYRNASAGDLHWLNEINNSYDEVKIHFQNSFNTLDNLELDGIRAIAWLENNIFGPLRIPFTGSRRWKISKYGRYYRPGMIEPCPFTGYCADEDFMQSIRDTINNGNCLDDVLGDLKSMHHKIIDDEEEHQNGDEYIIDTIEANEYEFNEDGTNF